MRQQGAPGRLNEQKADSLSNLQLGIPTANIPADDLSEKHPELTTGVYYGVVALDPKTYHHDASSDNSAVILPAVLSIGYNPFYKNTVRSVVSDHFKCLSFIKAHPALVNRYPGQAY